jgi:hypothetical protein
MLFSRHGTIRLLIAVTLCLITASAISSDRVKVGTKAPDFKLPVVLSDSTISLSDFIDKKIVIVHFWKSH